MRAKHDDGLIHEFEGALREVRPIDGHALTLADLLRPSLVPAGVLAPGPNSGPGFHVSVPEPQQVKSPDEGLAKDWRRWSGPLEGGSDVSEPRGHIVHGDVDSLLAFEAVVIENDPERPAGPVHGDRPLRGERGGLGAIERRARKDLRIGVAGRRAECGRDGDQRNSRRQEGPCTHTVPAVPAAVRLQASCRGLPEVE